MRNSAVEKFIYHMALPERDLEQYYSVEIPMYNLNVVYQFRIIENDPLSILIKEESDLLLWIKAGDRFKMRYYSNDPNSRYQDLFTELASIDRQSHGPLRGYYLTTLEITEDKHDKIVTWPYRLNDYHLIPFNMWSRSY